MNIRAVFFDIYGTLLEVGPAPPDAETRWQQLCRDQLGLASPPTRLQFSVATGRVIARHHAVARARGIPHPEVYWPAVVAGVLPEVAALSARDREEFLLRQIRTGHSTRLTPEAAATLRWLKERATLVGLASNAQAYTQRELHEALAAHGLGLDLFERDLSFWSCEHGFSKPDPHVFQILTSRLAARGIAPAESLMVGDRLDNDIQPASLQGWRTWHLGPAGNGDWGGLRAWLTRPRPRQGLSARAKPQ